MCSLSKGGLTFILVQHNAMQTQCWNIVLFVRNPTQLIDATDATQAPA